MKSLVTIVLFPLIALCSGCSLYRDVATFDLGDGFVCEVKMEDELEPADPYYYIIQSSSTVIIPTSYFTAYSEGEEPTFAIISSDDRRFIGLVTKERPSDILMMFDKHTATSWPRAVDRELPGEVALRGDRLLASLIEGSRRPDLKLSRDR